MADTRRRGLPAISQARAERDAGGVQWTTGAGIAAAFVLVGGFLGHKLIGGRAFANDREALLKKQRAVDATLGAEWRSFQAKIESAVLSRVQGDAADEVAPESASYRFEELPGLYLRFRKDAVHDTESLRRAIDASKKDAFVSCLMPDSHFTDAGLFSDRPWNLSEGYASLRVLSPSWGAEVSAIDEPLRLKIFEEQFEKASRENFPRAIDLVKRAQYLLLVLDEDVALAQGDAAISSELLQAVPHPARVHLIRLQDEKELFRVRRTAEATLVSDHTVTDPASRQAMARQANNCALARRVKEAVRPSAAR